MGSSILLDDLLPESKHVWIARVDGRTHPVGVGMAERRHSREVFDDSLALLTDERFVDAEDVCVSVDIDHGFSERERLLLERGDERLVPRLSPACRGVTPIAQCA